MFAVEMKKIQLTNVSAGKLGGLFCLNRSDSGLVGLFGRDCSNPAHTPNFLAKVNQNKYFLLNDLDLFR